MSSAHLLIAALLLPGNAQPDVVCMDCHPAEGRTYLASAMGRSIGVPDRVPAGDIQDGQSGSHIRAEWSGGKLIQRLSEDGLTAEHEIRYQIGAGKVGHSYAVAVKDVLLQSPASFYRRYGWDVSPGYAGSELLDFNRVLAERCLFCHSNPPGLFSGERFGVNNLRVISCERCHGETSAHLQQPSPANIVNPANLPHRARDSVCEQCHLEGVARVLNPGKALRMFRPGMNLEDTLAIYVPKQAGQGAKAVSQEEQLALSQCATRSQGKLWCGTCHNPHAQATGRRVQIKAICQSCHPVLSPATHAAVAECVSCHMPRRSPVDVAHAALTDHRILRRPDKSSETAAPASPDIRAWREPASDFAQRDLGLAYLQASANAEFQRLGETGAALLKSLGPSGRDDDAAVMTALGDTDLSQGRAAEAVPFFRRACALMPDSGEYAMYLGIALKQNGDLGAAKDALRRAIQLDPSLQRAYLELSALDAKEGRIGDASSVLDQYLEWNPQSILVRLMRQTLTVRNK